MGKPHKYSLTDEHRAQMAAWRDKWIANAMSTQPMDDEDRRAMVEAVEGLYRAANLTPPPRNRIVFVPSPFVLRFAGGFAAAVWYLRGGGEATKVATRDAARAAASGASAFAAYSATRTATGVATDAAAYSAAVNAVAEAIHATTRASTAGATYVPTDEATRVATQNAICGATAPATRVATRDAAYRATRDATDLAARDEVALATYVATNDATIDATHTATCDAARDATNAATPQAVYEATHAGIYVAARDAADPATADGTRAASVGATHEAIRETARPWTRETARNEMDETARAATDAATRQATDDASYAAVEAATKAAAREATRDTTATVTRGATGVAAHVATRDATAGPTDVITVNATAAAAHEAAGTRIGDDAWYAGISPGAMRAVAAQFGPADFLLACAASAHSMWDGGNQWSAWTASLSFFCHVARLDLPVYKQWRHYEAAAIHAGPRIMHKEFCIISDRPRVLKVDAQNRPHCEDGPWCQWADGTALYAIHGVRVPAWVVLHTERITAASALAEKNAEVRRVMIERLGIETFVRDAGLTPVQEDDCGKLYRLDDDTQMVEVINATPEADGSFRHFFLAAGPPDEIHTAEQAVADSFGLTAATYRALRDAGMIEF